MNDELKRLVGELSPDVMPEQLKPLISGLLDGTIRQFAVIMEHDDGTFSDCFPTTGENPNRFAMIGALEVLLRDYMRVHIDSRIEYVKRGDDGN